MKNVYARRGHDKMLTLLYCMYERVHTEERFTRLPSVLFNPVVILKSCLVNLSLLLLYLWSWVVLSVVWEWSGVSELMWHSCPSSPVHIFPLGIHLHTCTKNTHLPFTRICGPQVSWTQCHIPPFYVKYTYIHTHTHWHTHIVVMLPNWQNFVCHSPPA